MTKKTSSKRSAFETIKWSLLGGIGLLYLLNPGAGVLELIPDNIPLVGNLDEAAATLLILQAVKYLFRREVPPESEAKNDALLPKS